MKKILISLDYHPTSEIVAKEGKKIADQMNAEVHLIHVIGDIHFYNVNYPALFGYEFNSPGLQPFNSINQAVKRAEDFLEKAANEVGEEVNTTVTQGDAANSILAYAKEKNIDLIVMGTHSRSIFEKVFIGSVASKLLEKTKIPVYMIPINK